MRTRTNNQVIAMGGIGAGVFTNSGYWYHNGAPGGEFKSFSGQSMASCVHVADQVLETMVDDASRSRSAKTCIHYKGRLRVTTEGMPFYARLGSPAGYSRNVGGFWPHYTGFVGLAGAAIALGSVNTQNQIVIPGVNIATGQSDEWHASNLLKRARSPVVDGLLNLAEANQIPQALSAFLPDAKAVKRIWMSETDAAMLRSIKKLLRDAVLANDKSKIRGLLKRVTKSAADKYLAYSFGIAPLVSDLMKGHSFLQRTDSLMKQYDRASAKTVSSMVKPVASYAINDQNLIDRYGLPSRYTYQCIFEEVPVDRYVLRYRERPPLKAAGLRHLDAALRRFGSDGPISLLWELVPFSFVVDWFVKTDAVLGYLDSYLRTDPIQVLSFSRSRKCVCSCNVYRHVTDARTNAVAWSELCGVVDNRSYVRYPLAVPGFSAEGSGRFGKKQAGLSLALLRQLLR